LFDPLHLIRDGKEAHVFSFSHRLYSASELERARLAAALEDFRAFGSIDGRTYDQEAVRLVAAAWKGD
jgi:hypothetical protein